MPDLDIAAIIRTLNEHAVRYVVIGCAAFRAAQAAGSNQLSAVVRLRERARARTHAPLMRAR